MNDKYISASSTPSTTLPLPKGKQEGRRRRAGLLSSLLQTLFPSRTEGKRSPVPVILAVLLWIGLAYAGYAFAVHTLDKQQQFIDQRFAQVQEENQQKMSEMSKQLALVQDELKNVQGGLSSIEEELQLTGQTIGGTNKTKEALQDRIDQLNKQLVDLKSSLKKLEDAARAW